MNQFSSWPPLRQRRVAGRFMVEPLESRIAPAVASAFFLGSLDGDNGFIVPGIVGSDEHGRGVSVVGDVNGDGFDDVLIGTPFAAAAAGFG